MKIKAIIFDIGDVILLEHDEEVFPKLVSKFEITEEHFMEVRKKYISKALTIRRNTFWYERKIARELKINPKNFIEHWQSLREKNFEFNKEAKNILESLKLQDYTLISLTNVTYSHELIRNKMKIYSYFDLNIKSRDKGIMKPSEKLFKIIFKKTKLLPQQILFIDDKEYNLELARELGINTIQFRKGNYKQLKKDFKKFYIELK